MLKQTHTQTHMHTQARMVVCSINPVAVEADTRIFVNSRVVKTI